MAKTWLTVHLYVDNDTGEYIEKIDLDNNIIKKKIKTRPKYNGKYNIKEITWLVERRTKQLRIW